MSLVSGLNVDRSTKKWTKDRDYFDFNSYQLPAGVGNFYDLISQKVEAKTILRIREIQTYVNQYVDWTKVQWDFCINGIPIYPLNARTDQIGAPGQLMYIGENTIECPGGSVFSVRITNLDGAAAHIGGVTVRGEWGNYIR